jgi:hypothetical protein
MKNLCKVSIPFFIQHFVCLTIQNIFFSLGSYFQTESTATNKNTKATATTNTIATGISGNELLKTIATNLTDETNQSFTIEVLIVIIFNNSSESRRRYYDERA